ncbi:type VI secretion system-associated protein TagF [Variovorax ginsengisoli]|uniref:Type VI secretion system protein ImpM n=1 Tax=Variovorax ginsengisoli TaxID=363844 RepID=A0ABT9S9J5_9BURK|nr:type VI secretion system-associated protein TagF [Variovorax ginsengisoli]MDP9901026.1 type VI secretion system protein ImpM [Variovorax ginsengisoli]
MEPSIARIAMLPLEPAPESKAAAVGWYGKLPSLGDFASRRLGPDFVEAWDAWLAQGIASWRHDAPDTWLDEYLAAPSWRFILMPSVLPGACGQTAWAGVLMPSVDRVGRYFPLTLAQPLSPLPGDGGTTEWMLRWLQRLDDIALDALNDDWTIDQLESALIGTGTWPPSEDPADGPIAGIDLHAQPPGMTLWLRPDAAGRTQIHTERGLPCGAAFRQLVSGTSAAAAAPLLPVATLTSTSAHDH